MTNKTALIFDLDGTLADTNQDLHAAMNYVLTQRGLPTIVDAHLQHMIGGGARMILQRGFAEHNVHLSDQDLDTATEEFVDWYDQNIDTHTRLYPHVKNIIDHAHRHGVRLGVATNKRESLAAKLLFRLRVHHYFDTLIGGDTLATRKPDAAPILQALIRLDVAPQNAVMLGDSDADTQSARAASVASCCVSFGYSRTPIAELNPDAIIDDFRELPAALIKLRPQQFARVFDKYTAPS